MKIKIGRKYYLPADEAGKNSSTIRSYSSKLTRSGKDPKDYGYIKIRGGWYVEVKEENDPE